MDASADVHLNSPKPQQGGSPTEERPWEDWEQLNGRNVKYTATSLALIGYRVHPSWAHHATTASCRNPVGSEQVLEV